MNRPIIFILALCFLFVISAPLTAFAQDKPSAYVTVKPGVYIPTSDLENRGFDNNFTGEIAVGTYYSPNFAIEAGVGYFQTKASRNVSGLNLSDKMWVVPVTFTFKGVLPMKGFELTGGGGGGVYFANITEDGSTSSGSFSNDAHSTALGVHVEAGVNVDISPRIFLGAEGKYIFTTEADLLGSKVDLDGAMVTGVVGYRF
jgi:outer membrane protein W